MVGRRNASAEQGFSLIEIALVLIIIAVIIGGVGIARDAKQDADMLKIYKRVVEPCVAGAARGKMPVPAISSCLSIANDVARIAHTDAEVLRTMALEKLTSDFTVGAVVDDITPYFEISVFP